MQASTATIHPLGQAIQARSVDTHQKLTTLIALCPWVLEVDHILHAAGHQLSPAVFESPALPPIRDSDAAKFGHATLEQFITRPLSELGLGMEWDAWGRKAGASYYKKKFSIFHDDSDRVMAEYEDVVSALKREPANAMEYAQVRIEIMEQLHQQQKDETAARLESMRQRGDALNRDLNASMDVRSDLERKCAELSNQLEAMPRQHQAELELMASQFETEREMALIELRNEMELAGETKVSQATIELRARISDLSRQIDGLRILAQDENRVPRADYVSLNHELKKQKDISAHYAQNNEELMRKLAQTTADLKASEDEVGRLNDELNRLRNMMEQIERRLVTGDNAVTNAVITPVVESAEEMAALKSMVEQMSRDIEALEARNQNFFTRDQQWAAHFERANGNYAKAMRDLLQLKQRQDRVRSAMAASEQRVAIERHARELAEAGQRRSQNRALIAAVMAIIAFATAFTTYAMA